MMRGSNTNPPNHLIASSNGMTHVIIEVFSIDKLNSLLRIQINASHVSVY